MQQAKFYLSKERLKEQYGIIRDKCDIVSYSLKTNLIVGQVLEEETDCWISIHFIRNLSSEIR